MGLFDPNVTPVESSTELPPWFNDYGEWYAQASQAMADRPYVPIEGERFAGFDPMQQAAFGGMDVYGQMGLPALGGAYNALSDMGGYGMAAGGYGGMGNAYAGYQDVLGGLGGMDPITAQQVQAAMSGFTSAGDAQQGQASLASRGAIQDVLGGSYLDMDRDAYMNQFTDSVTGDVLSDLQRSWQQQEQIQRSQANAAGAFGGSRHGVLDALTGSEYQRNAGQLSNQLRSQAFDAASGLMGQDLGRALQAGLANQGMDWNVQNLNANLGTNTSLQNALMGNQMNQFNAGQQNQVGMFNAGQQNTVGLGNAANALTAAGLNQNTTSQMLQGLAGMGSLGANMGQLGLGVGNLSQQQGMNLANFGQAGLANQLAAGNQQQQFEQQQLDYNDFLAREARDWQANNFGAFAGGPMGMNTGSTQYGQMFSPSTGNNIIGGASTIIGGLGALNDIFGWV